MPGLRLALTETARFSVDRIGESELKTPSFSFSSLLDSVPRCLYLPLNIDTRVCRGYMVLTSP